MRSGARPTTSSPIHTIGQPANPVTGQLDKLKYSTLLKNHLDATPFPVI
jgi:hypothetical protein